MAASWHSILSGRFVLLLLLAAGCEDSPAEPGGRHVAGVDVDALFAPPTDAEIAVVEAEWEGREVPVEGYRLERSISWSLDGASATLQAVSHVVDGNRHFGMVLVPAGFSAGDLPVLLYAHGGDNGIGADEFLAITGAARLAGSDFVFVAPSFRSEPLDHPEATFHSEGAPSPWDRDVDDALALLNTVLATVPESDSTRIGVLGVSRGGGVALLMGIRDPRVDALVSLFGPTDFFDGYVRDIVEDALRGTLRPLPGLAHLDTAVVQPLREGALSIEEVRLELVRRSSVLFVDRLPPLQLHHGTADEVVSISQATRMEQALLDAGRTPPEAEVIIYSGAGHTPADMPLALPRAFDFLERIR